ncbi:MAG: protein kinase [Deltaproteobacteria bacterium]|nr:protein kinase [Deltaproteobacteria bacterium]MDH3898899.1 protein kinase [Deltaproteobacteria bacterium]MDH3930060.1 protein kinase [Deltaproteobacteria bacterium]MDH3951685.1 protein kinase [Deltaproteobacteria bacterium]MDH3964252.1 protein kinase [Deltaproteobacteria bacterium]
MAKRRILIIDSQEQDVQNLKEVLEDGGYQVAVAFSSHDGLRLAQDLFPEVVLLAIQSPGLNGLQILLDLKKRGTTRDLPVLILLEKFDEEYAAQGLQMGAADYLLKAASKDLLLRRVGVLARIRQQDRERRDVISRYKGFFDGEQHGLFLSSREGRFLDVNQNLIRLLGYGDRNELLEIDIENDLYFDPQDRQHFREIIESQGYVDNLKVNFKRKDGEKITMLLSGRLVRDEKGGIAGYEGYNVEVAEQPEAEQPLEEQPEEQRFLGRFLKHLVPKVLPFGAGFFSLMKMTELIAERYEKVERLGLGSFGEVWKVRDTEREGRAPYYVAKIPTSKKLNNQFRKEAAICRRLEGHPNSTKIIDVVEERGRVVLIQEFVEGPSLRELLEGPLEKKRKEKILLQLVDIVAYAHKHRIVHRDVKPENVVVRRDSVVKLLDYGVAKELKEKDISSTMVGSRPFMAPEQISGESQIASDVWALGIIMYAVYTGYLPFYHDNEKILMDLILTMEPRTPREVEPDIPVELEGIILKCLKKDPKERFADAGILKATILETFPQFGKNT